jgi:hypothetical protein
MEHAWESFSGFTLFSAVLISAIGLALHVRWSRRSTALGPAILTTLGIFFCFAGIAWGLLHFDPHDVRSSVPLLLQGIRTAFWSSVVGIFWALTLKIRVVLLGDASAAASGSREGSTVDDLARLLAQVDSSVAGGNGRLDRLAEAFSHYEERAAESNSRALVGALSVVVRDFNTKINEQFGDNFLQLNAAVARLVAWQDQYEKQLEDSIAQATAARESMTEATARFTDVVNMTSEFAAVARSLQDTVATLNTQSGQLARALMLLSGLIVEVEEGLPLIEKRIVQIIARSRQSLQREQEARGAEPRRAAESLRATRA